MQSSYEMPIERLKAYDFARIGSHYVIGDKVRLTYRLFNSSENNDAKTKDIFEKKKEVNHAL